MLLADVIDCFGLILSGRLKAYFDYVFGEFAKGHLCRYAMNACMKRL